MFLGIYMPTRAHLFVLHRRHPVDGELRGHPLDVRVKHFHPSHSGWWRGVEARATCASNIQTSSKKSSQQDFRRSALDLGAVGRHLVSVRVFLRIAQLRIGRTSYTAVWRTKGRGSRRRLGEECRLKD